MVLLAMANVLALFCGISEVCATTVPVCVCCVGELDDVVGVEPPVLATGVLPTVVVAEDVVLPDKKYLPKRATVVTAAAAPPPATI